MSDLKTRMEKIVKKRGALNLIQWPMMYSAALYHLMNENLKRGLPIQFYYSYGETFLTVDEISTKLKQDCTDLKLNKDGAKLTKTLNKIKKTIDDMIKNKTPIEDGVFYEIGDEDKIFVDYVGYSISLYKSEDPIKPQASTTEQLVADKNMKVLRQTIVTYVDTIINTIDELSKEKPRPSTPPKIMKKDIFDGLKQKIEHYYANVDDPTKNVEKYVVAVINGKDTDKGMAVRSGLSDKTSAPRTGAMTGKVTKRAFAIKTSKGVETQGNFILDSRNTYMGKEREKWINEFKIDEAEANKAAKFEIDLDYELFFKKVFGDKNEYVFSTEKEGIITIYKDAGIESARLLPKDDDKLKQKLKKASDLKASQFVLPAKLGNFNNEEFEEAQKIMKQQVEAGKAAPLSGLLQEVSKEVNENLITMKVKPAMEKIPVKVPSKISKAEFAGWRSTDEYEDDE